VPDVWKRLNIDLIKVYNFYLKHFQDDEFLMKYIRNTLYSSTLDISLYIRNILLLIFTVMSCHQNAGHNHNFLVADNLFENVAELKYLGTAVTNQNYIHKEIEEKIKFKECLVAFSSESFVFHLLSKKFKIKIYKTIITPVVLYGCET
jgi:hypothetical protein